MNRIETYEQEGKKYPLVFSLLAGQKIEDKYVPVEKIGDLLVNPKKYNVNGIKVAKDILYIFIEEGIKYCQLKGISEYETELPDYHELFDFLEYKSISNITEAIYNCMIGSKKNK